MSPQRIRRSKQESSSPHARIAEYRIRLKLNAKDIEARILLGRAYRDGGDYAAAMVMWKSALELEPSNQQAKRLIGALEADLIKINFAL